MTPDLQAACPVTAPELETVEDLQDEIESLIGKIEHACTGGYHLTAAQRVEFAKRIMDANQSALTTLGWRKVGEGMKVVNLADMEFVFEHLSSNDGICEDDECKDPSCQRAKSIRRAMLAALDTEEG